jgi:YidC/Oxa1 family membrane protein insertase
MFDWLYKLLGSMLAWFSSWTGSYALALLFYALIFKILFVFFSVKQQKNQISMAKLTPKIEVIKAKYRGRNDQATQRKMQEEIMALQQQEGYSPFSGCLPLLLQMPIIIFLYNVIRNPLSHIAKLSNEAIVAINTVVTEKTLEFKAIDQITLAGQLRDFVGKSGGITSELTEAGLTSMEAIPNFSLWGIDLAAKPVFLGITVLIPILATALQWFTMWITKKINGNPQAAMASGDQSAQTNASMKIMDLIMPAMTLWLTFSFSSMMGLYWIYQSILTIIQTLIISKLMPIPKFTEEELIAIKKAQKAAEKAQKAIIKTQPKYKSLHYIDEDDYDELPEVKGNQDKKKSVGDPSSRPEIKD